MAKMSPTSWGVNGGSFLECCAGGLTVAKNRRLGLVFVNNWLWTKGRETFNFGGQFRRTYQDIINCDFCGGTFNFSQRTTSTPNSSDPNFGTYGSSFASFLLGQADAEHTYFSDELYMRNKAFAFYAQDDIKYNSRLTLNVGLRYDIMVPFTENNNNIIFVNTSEPNPGAGDLPGAATKFGNCTGCAGIGRAAISWKNWQPRIGFGLLGELQDDGPVRLLLYYSGWWRLRIWHCPERFFHGELAGWPISACFDRQQCSRLRKLGCEHVASAAADSV